MSLITERILVKPDMSIEDEKTLGSADIVYGLAGTLVLVSGIDPLKLYFLPSTG